MISVTTSIVYTLAYIFNIINFLYFIERLFTRKYHYSLIISFSILCLLAILNSTLIFSIVYLKILLTILVLIIICLFFYSGDLIWKLLCPFLIIITMSFSEVFTVLIIVMGLHIPYTQISNLAITMSLVLALDNIFIFILLNILLTMLKRKISKKSDTYFLIFIMALMPYTLALPYFLVFRNFSEYVFINYVCLLICVLLTIICDYFLLKKTIVLDKQIKQEITNNLYHQFYLDIMKSYIELKEQKNDYRKIRHYLINYIEKIKCGGNNND